MSGGTLSGTFNAKSRSGVIFLLLLASFILPHIPILNLIALPLSSFTTTIHECSHAVACLLTGGTVSGMTIVADGAGHGGLTFCRGGNPFIYTQAGYIGTALVGCALIWLGHFPKLSKPLLFVIGATFGLSGLIFMGSTVLRGGITEGLASMALAIAMGAGMIWVSLKLNFYWANLLLLFLGIQTALNAINDDAVLAMQAMGMMGQTWSDASNMTAMTGIPAVFWAGLWTLIAVGLVWKTLKICGSVPKIR